MAFLSLQGVSKGYGPAHARTEVLEGIDLHIERGEFVAIVGWSGAGKTTLVSMLAGLVTPDRGTLTMDGRRIREPGPERAVVFQNYSLLPWISCYENVHLAVDQVFPKWSAAEKRAHTEAHLAKVNLSAARDKRPAQLSGGMRQRVALARALATNPEVLLMDEPLSALDALTRSTLQDELLRIWAADRKTVLLVTNDVDEALLLADRIVPLGVGPRATFGPSIAVDLPRPRERRSISHQPRFKELRRQVLAWLLGPGRRVGGPPIAGVTAPAGSTAPAGVTAPAASTAPVGMMIEGTDAVDAPSPAAREPARREVAA